MTPNDVDEILDLCDTYPRCPSTDGTCWCREMLVQVAESMNSGDEDDR